MAPQELIPPIFSPVYIPALLRVDVPPHHLPLRPMHGDLDLHNQEPRSETLSCIVRCLHLPQRCWWPRADECNPASSWWLPPQVPAEVSTAVVDPSHLEKQFHHSEQRLGVVEEGEDDPEMIVRGRVIERGRGR